MGNTPADASSSQQQVIDMLLVLERMQHPYWQRWALRTEWSFM
jgi:hypothetical protein